LYYRGRDYFPPRKTSGLLLVFLEHVLRQGRGRAISRGIPGPRCSRTACDFGGGRILCICALRRETAGFFQGSSSLVRTFTYPSARGTRRQGPPDSAFDGLMRVSYFGRISATPRDPSSVKPRFRRSSRQIPIPHMSTVFPVQSLGSGCGLRSFVDAQRSWRRGATV